MVCGVNLKLWPSHCHVGAVVVRPPFQIHSSVRLVNRLTKTCVDVRNSMSQTHKTHVTATLKIYNLQFYFFLKQIKKYW